MYCGKDNSMNEILMQLMHGHFLRAHSYFEKIGLHPGQTKLLLMLRKLNGLSQREICDELNVKPSTIAVMIKRMEKTELIERKNDEHDQRISRVFITDKGMEICKTLEDINSEIEKECLKNFTEEEIEISKQFLIRMRDNLMIANKNKIKFECCKDSF